MNDNLHEILKHNLTSVRERIADATARSGRTPDSVRLLAVTKFVSPEITRALHELGQKNMGENRLAPAREKLAALSDLDITWHWIGSLQTNKARRVLESFRVIHAVDRPHLVEVLESIAKSLGGPPISVFIQVNVSGETTKAGAAPDRAQVLVEQALQCPSLRVEGLMTMAPFEDDPELTRPVFAATRELRDALSQAIGADLPRLSMGMSNDFEVAIEEGATDVRIGSLVFEGLGS